MVMMECVGIGVSLLGDELYIKNFLAILTWTSYLPSLASISPVLNEDNDIYPLMSLWVLLLVIKIQTFR